MNDRGSIHIQITQAPIEIAPGACCTDEEGAEVRFCGVVRRHNRGRAVRAVQYEVYEPLAKNIMTNICRAAQDTFGKELSLCVCHRKGCLEVGELSILITASSPHRDEAFRAARLIIEEVKHRVPIWKKEFYEDGEGEWVQGHSLCSHAPSPANGGS